MKQSFFWAVLMMTYTALAFDTMPISDKTFSGKNLTNLRQGDKEIILTFDDGPTPNVTTKVLDILEQYNIKATFFTIGEKAKVNTKLLQRMLDQGHIVANHTLTHPLLGELDFFKSEDILQKEIFGAHQIIVPYMSNSKHFYFRAPGGSWKKSLAEHLNSDPIAENYIGPVYWDIGGELQRSKDGQIIEAADWACWSKKLSVDECLTGYLNEAKKRKGGVVLMHDLKPQSAELLSKFIPKLIEQGYTFRTLDDINWDAIQKPSI